MSSFTGFQGKPNMFQEDLDRYYKSDASRCAACSNHLFECDRLVMSFVPFKSGQGRVLLTRMPTAHFDTVKEKRRPLYLPNKRPICRNPGPDPKVRWPQTEKIKLSKA